MRGLFHRCGFADCGLAWILGAQRAVVRRGQCNVGERGMGGFSQCTCVPGSHFGGAGDFRSRYSIMYVKYSSFL